MMQRPRCIQSGSSRHVRPPKEYFQRLLSDYVIEVNYVPIIQTRCAHLSERDMSTVIKSRPSSLRGLTVRAQSTPGSTATS